MQSSQAAKKEHENHSVTIGGGEDVKHVIRIHDAKRRPHHCFSFSNFFKFIFRGGGGKFKVWYNDYAKYIRICDEVEYINLH